MEYKAKLSYLKISPRKVRLVADLVRNQKVDVAQVQLQYSTKRASVPLLKLLKSAISNAKNMNEDIKEASLYIKEISVNGGPMYKRYMPVARGSVHEIQKKTSHITIIIKEQERKRKSLKKSKAGDDLLQSTRVAPKAKKIKKQKVKEQLKTINKSAAEQHN